MSLIHCHSIFTCFLTVHQKDKQKKKRGAKGILLDAEGDATLEDFPNVSQGNGPERSPEVERPKPSNKKV